MFVSRIRKIQKNSIRLIESSLMTITRLDSHMLESNIVGGMEVKPEDIQELLEFFSKNTYKAKDAHPKVGKSCISST